LFKAATLFRGEFSADLFVDGLQFLAQFRRNLFPYLAAPFLALADNLFDAFVLARSQGQLFPSAQQKFHTLQLARGLIEG
jgi:hypothetical protein